MGIPRAHRRLAAEEGFTLIELLVVILIIGILAAIATPAFLNQRSKGVDVAAKSMARTVQTTLKTYYTDNNTYDCTNGGATTCSASLAVIEPTLSGTSGTGDGQWNVTGLSSIGYTVTATSANGDSFTIVDVAGVVVRPCTVAAGNGSNRGGCPANGFW